MLTNRIIISKTTDPYYNLAMEEQLFNNIKDDEIIFYLWKNHKTVVIGRNQNPYIECDVDYVKKNGAKVARRMSGGGTVYHDLGNLNFTFITTKKNYDMYKQMMVIKNAVEKFGITVSESGRNDLIVEDKKFSGHAFYEDDGKCFHHGTIMIDVNKEELKNILRPSKLKLESKGITSVKSRVINLKECENSINLENITENLIRSFEIVYGEISDIRDSCEEDLKEAILSKYRSNKWIYGESPQFNVKLETKLEIGNVQLLMNVKDNLVDKVRIYSDTLMKVSFDCLEEAILFQEFDEEKILSMVKAHFNKVSIKIN
ncbi:lipoate--protein ligase [Clostridium sp.]|uniref:lipoate--protein ligase n=1 Tax=Clostridium sp. TaxID=1506 RepID=UPI0032176AD2